METQQCAIHKRDFVEALGDVLWLLARKSPDLLIDVLEREEYRPDPTLSFVTTALGNARGRRATDALLAALKHKNPWIRLSAAGALIGRPGKQVDAALLDALKDRTTLVKFTILEAMCQGKLPCDPRAVPALRRIIASRQIQKHSPGILSRAQEVLQRIETKPSTA
jgi:HEAT repeat protein